MRKIAGLVLLISMLASCNLNGSSDKYFIEGTVKNHAAKSISLEKLGLQKITVVDSSSIDSKGEFKMSGISETGFYRLKLDDRTYFLFLLSPANALTCIRLMAHRRVMNLRVPLNKLAMDSEN